MDFTHRIATEADLPKLSALMSRAIEHLQSDFLSAEQIRASHKVMGLDSQLVRDRTYFMIEHDGVAAGCGGWSFRATLYGGDDSVVVREPERLDPAKDAAKVRAMYTDPNFARRGVGRLLLTLCEDGARAAGFNRVELMATLAGAPLYKNTGYKAVREAVEVQIEGVTVPLVLMSKDI